MSSSSLDSSVDVVFLHSLIVDVSLVHCNVCDVGHKSLVLIGSKVRLDFGSF